ncbi:PAS domain-containing protein [Azospirillum tabaci]|uniref:PAS domain-containing protein n=1 Tax=Azospirillum tabaci TaxID=2752310 RepID=UPI001B3BF83F|nr:PAS domain-containing protein [Azospirillum tabaci]
MVRIGSKAADVANGERNESWIERELSGDLLVYADHEGYLLRICPSCSRLLGYERALRERPYTDLIHPDDIGLVRGKLDELCDSGRPVRFEDWVCAADRSWRWIASTLSLDPDGRHLHGVGRDIIAERAATVATALVSLARQLRALVPRQALRHRGFGGALPGGKRGREAEDLDRITAGAITADAPHVVPPEWPQPIALNRQVPAAPIRDAHPGASPPAKSQPVDHSAPPPRSVPRGIAPLRATHRGPNRAAVGRWLRSALRGASHPSSSAMERRSSFA